MGGCSIEYPKEKQAMSYISENQHSASKTIEELRAMTGVTIHISRGGDMDPLTQGRSFIGIRDKYNNAIALRIDADGRMSICDRRQL